MSGASDEKGVSLFSSSDTSPVACRFHGPRRLSLSTIRLRACGSQGNVRASQLQHAIGVKLMQDAADDLGRRSDPGGYFIQGEIALNCRFFSLLPKTLQQQTRQPGRHRLEGQPVDNLPGLPHRPHLRWVKSHNACGQPNRNGRIVSRSQTRASLLREAMSEAGIGSSSNRNGLQKTSPGPIVNRTCSRPLKERISQRSSPTRRK